MVDDDIFHFSLFIIMMKEIIKILSKDEIVGLHTIGNPDDDMYCGKIIKYEDDKLYFQTYDNSGEAYEIIQAESSDIEWFETNSADTEYLTKVITNKDKFIEKEEETIIGNEISEQLHNLWEKEIPALYHIKNDKDGYYAYLIGHNENTIILHSFNPYYNIDYGISCFPIANLEKIEVYKPELNIYPYLYDNRINVKKCHIESADIRLGFFRKSMNEKMLVNVQNSTDIKNEEDLVGYVESIQEDVICFRKINPVGVDCGLEKYNVKDIVTFGYGGSYLDKIERLYKIGLSKKAEEDITVISDRDKFISMLLYSKEKGTVVSLISNETEGEYCISTGFVIDVMKDWIHLKLYDFEEYHWYECYRRIQDFSKLQRNGITELLVKSIFDKQKL